MTDELRDGVQPKVDTGGDGTSDAGFTIGYHLGTVGAWVRILIGVVASGALLLIDLTQVEMSFLLETSAWLGAILALYMVVFALLVRRVLPRLNPWVSTVVFYGPVLVVPYLEAVPDTLRVAMSVYVTVSVLIAVLVRYGGCEVVGIPSLILRRRYVVYCPWNTVDLVDKAIEDSGWSSFLQSKSIKVIGVVVAVAIISAGGLLLDEAFPLVWGATAIASLLVISAAVLISRRA